MCRCMSLVQYEHTSMHMYMYACKCMCRGVCVCGQACRYICASIVRMCLDAGICMCTGMSTGAGVLTGVYMDSFIDIPCILAPVCVYIFTTTYSGALTQPADWLLEERVSATQVSPFWPLLYARAFQMGTA